MDIACYSGWQFGDAYRVIDQPDPPEYDLHLQAPVRALRLQVAIVVFAWHAVVSAEPPHDATILIVDSPVALDHPLIHPYVDEARMKSTKVNVDGRTVSLWDLSLEERRRFEARHEFGVLPGIHGTQMASLITGSLQKGHLLALPGVTAEGTDTKEKIEADFAKTPKELSKEMWDWFLPLDQTLKQNRVDIVNMSIGLSAEELVTSYSALLRTHDCEHLRPQLKEFAKRTALAHQAAFKKLVKENPDVVFVVAAGSEQVDLRRDFVTSLGAVKAPNVVVVTKETRTGQIVGNISPDHVSVSALGQEVAVAGPGRGWTTQSGSSVSTALVTQRLATLVEKSGSRPVRELLADFYKNETEADPKLENQIHEGRRMIRRSRGRAEWDPIPAASVKELNARIHNDAEVRERYFKLGVVDGSTSRLELLTQSVDCGVLLSQVFMKRTAKGVRFVSLTPLR